MPNPLIEKYRVKNFQDIKGQDQLINQVDDFYKKFPKKKALILNGPVGTGKTSIAIALANEYNLELFELNSSDLRNKKKLIEHLKPALTQMPLFKKGKLILMDEADGVTGSDRGGVPELVKLIKETRFPIIITANNIWKKKFSPLRRACQIISVKELKPHIIEDIIKKILIKENKKLNPKTITTITNNARGDVRAALNNLQTVFNIGEEKFLSEMDERNKEESVFNALKNVFQEPTKKEILGVFDKTNLELNEALLWVEENIPLEYKGSALARAYNSVSKADVFRGRIYRQQYWRFLFYQNFFLSAGVSAATKLKYKKFTKYKKPTRILKIWIANQKNAKKKSIISKYSQYAHMSKKKAMKDAYLIPLLINQNIHEKLDLNDKETEWLKEKKQDLKNRIKI